MDPTPTLFAPTPALDHLPANSLPDTIQSGLSTASATTSSCTGELSTLEKAFHLFFMAVAVIGILVLFASVQAACVRRELGRRRRAAEDAERGLVEHSFETTSTDLNRSRHTNPFRTNGGMPPAQPHATGTNNFYHAYPPTVTVAAPANCDDNNPAEAAADVREARTPGLS